MTLKLIPGRTPEGIAARTNRSVEQDAYLTKHCVNGVLPGDCDGTILTPNGIPCTNRDVLAVNAFSPDVEQILERSYVGGGRCLILSNDGGVLSFVPTEKGNGLPVEPPVSSYAIVEHEMDTVDTGTKVTVDAGAPHAVVPVTVERTDVGHTATIAPSAPGLEPVTISTSHGFKHLLHLIAEWFKAHV